MADDIDSPVIKLLLQSWTSEPELLQQFSRWLASAIDGSSSDNEMLILSRLPPEVCDGFVSLLFPILREHYGVDLTLHRREWQETFADLKVVPSTLMC